MDRRPQPPLPPWSSIANTGPQVITLRLRLRPRAGPTLPPPPPPPPATRTRTMSPLLNSHPGGLDGEGAPPPTLPTTTIPTNALALVSSTAGAVDCEGLTTPPPPSPTTATSTTVSAAAGAVDGEGQRPLPLRARSTPDEDAPSLFNLLPADLVLRVAILLRSSHQDLERMRSVCRAWREVIPSTIDPFLVLSKKDPDARSEVILLDIARTKREEDAVFNRKLPFSRPPAGVSCWGSALGLLALRSHYPDDRQIFVHCLHYAKSKSMLSLPMGMTPNGLFLEPLTPLRFILMAASANGDSILRVDRDNFPWRMEGGPWWLPLPGFDDTPLRSMALSPGVLRAGVSGDSIIIIDESGRALYARDELLRLHPPPLHLSDGTLVYPWAENGQHLFLCEKQLYFAQIFDSKDAPEGVGVRLFLVKKSGEVDYSLLPTLTIGDFSVYIGRNQSFALPSVDPLVGRLANTLYIEDSRGSNRQPCVLAINFESLKTFMIPFPEDVTAAYEELLPAVWAGLPHHSNVVNHCQANDCWRFWD